MNQAEELGSRLLGKAAGDYELVRLVADGSFSWVFQGNHRGDDSACMIKVAKPADQLGRRDSERLFPTLAQIFLTGGLTEVIPDAQQLLHLEYTTLSRAKGDHVVGVGKFETAGPFWFYQMDFVNAPNLRRWSEFQPTQLQVGIQLARTVERLSQAGLAHGDLKPDNILVNAHGITLIDPGYFGPIDADPVNVEFCAVSTPQYYPFVQPDDLFACGVIFWELAMGRHPFDGSGLRRGDAKIGESLAALLEVRQNIGQYWMSPIWNMKLPSVIRADISGEYEEFLLKGLRLVRTADGGLDCGPGFADAGEMVERLVWLESQGQDHF